MTDTAESALPPRPDIKPGRYRHYKGNFYQVVDVALHSETLQWHVIYRALYGDMERLWIRPHSMFVESVIIDGRQQPRFTYVSE